MNETEVTDKITDMPSAYDLNSQNCLEESAQKKSNTKFIILGVAIFIGIMVCFLFNRLKGNLMNTSKAVIMKKLAFFPMSAKFEKDEYGYMVITSQESFDKLEEYRVALLEGKIKAGDSLSKVLKNSNISSMTAYEFIDMILSTKIPLVFAENYRPLNKLWPWTLTEVELLGDINIAMSVQIFDDGKWHEPMVHLPPFQGYLMFTPGIVLHKECQFDYRNIVENGAINIGKYYETYERRLLPLLKFANDESASKGTMALVTIPGIGCGAFAGQFKNEIGGNFKKVIKDLLLNHGEELRNISLIYFNQNENPDLLNIPSSQSENIHGIKFLCSYTNDPNHKNLLDKPSNYGKTYQNHILFAFVAWDHLSYPGNDFFKNDRYTDDGVKAAATSSMTSLLAVQGVYKNFKYSPEYLNSMNMKEWGKVVEDLNYKLNTKDGGLFVLKKDKTTLHLEEHSPIQRKFYLD